MQIHQEVGGTARTSQDLAGHVISSQDEYAAKGGNVAGEIDGEIHSKTAETCW